MAIVITKTETNYDQVSGVGFATHTLTTGIDDIVINNNDDLTLNNYTTTPKSMTVRYNTSAGGRTGITDHITLRFYIGETYIRRVTYDNMVKIEGGWQRYATRLNANTDGTVPLDPYSQYWWDTTHTVSDYFNASNKTSATVPIDVYVYSGRVATGTFVASSTYGDGLSPAVAYGDFSNNLVGTINLRLNVPPTFDNTALSIDTTTAYTNITTASVTVSNATAYYGGDISSATLTIGNQTASISGNGTISILLNAGGTFIPTLSITDSRGQVATKSLDPITVNVYTAPSVSFNVERTTSTGAPEDEGTYATVDATFTFADVIADAIAPTVTVTDEDGVQTTPTVTWYSTRGADGTLSGSVTWSSLSSGDTVYGLIPNLNTEFSWQIAITPKDSEGTGTPITQTLAGAFYTIDFLAGGHGIAFGKPAINTGFECAMDATFEDTLTAQDMTAQEVDDFIDSIGGGGDPIADVVVEVGTSGIWTYRKWSSGIAECWGAWSGTKQCTGANGALYDNTGSQALPFTFTSAPYAITNATTSGGYFGYVAVTPSTTSLSLVFVCSNNASRTWYVKYYVIGRWK